MAFSLNKKKLLSNAKPLNIKKAREIILDVFEEVLKKTDPRILIKTKVKLIDNVLYVDKKTYDLKIFNKIIVLGFGKASGFMAEALERILDEKIDKGLIIIPKGTSKKFKTNFIKFVESSHPIPDFSSVKAANKILNIVKKIQKTDLVIFLISGGGSSLMALPKEPISLKDKMKINKMLINSGASIGEINAVRKHLSEIKGGKLACKVFPATIINLFVSDVIDGTLETIASGPTVLDSTSFSDAIKVLKKYELWKKLPNNVRIFLSKGSMTIESETLKNKFKFKKIQNVVIGDNKLACFTAVNKFKNLGIKTLLLSTFMEGESRDIGFIFGAIAREILLTGNPLPPPVAIIMGGESTVSVIGNGKGGRNQELVLATALKINRLDNVVMASLSTDGIDGPTDAAGAIADGYTLFKSEKKGMNPQEYLKNNDSYSFFSKIEDLIFTGITGTNVNDLSILMVF
jgi:glycerate-2-kinase